MKTHNTHAAPEPGSGCAAFAPLLPVMNEADIDADDLTSLRAHLETCPYCQDQLASYERLDAAMRRHLGPAAVPRLSAADILRGFAPESQHTTPTLAADRRSERAALLGRSHPQSNDQEADRHPFRPERQGTMQTPVLAFRTRWTLLQRLSAIAAAVLLVALVGSLAAGLVLVRNHGNNGQTSTTQESIYIVTNDESTGASWVYKLNAQSHTLQWKTQVGGQVSGGAIVVDGIVYVNAPGNGIIALNASDGSPRWGSIPLVPYFGSAIFGSALVVGGGAVYTPGGDGSVYAFNASTGAPLWHTPVAADSTEAQDGLVIDLTYGDGVLYGNETQTQVGLQESSLFALNAATGVLLWRTSASDGQIFGAPQFANNMVFVSLSPSDEPAESVAAYNAKTGVQLWHSQLVNANLYITPTIVNRTLYLVGYDTYGYAGAYGAIYALNTTDGTVLWSYSNPSDGEAFFNPPEVVGGVLYISGRSALDKDFVLALNASNGTVRWRYRANFLDESLAVQNGVLYISLDTGVLYALRAADGSVLWHASYVTGFFYGSAPVTVAP